MPALILKPRATLFALAFCALLAACAKDSTPSASNISADARAAGAVVANVNGRAISAKLYEMFLRNGRDALGIDEATPEGRRARAELQEGIVSDLIDRALVSADAERRGLRVTNDALDERERRETTQRGGEEKFRSFLSDHGLTREEYREVLRDQLYGEMLSDEAGKNVSVSDDEVKKYYGEHKDDPAFEQPARVTAAHVLVAARPTVIAEQLRAEKHLAGDALATAVRDEVARRREKAEELRRRAAAGADFTRLAREASDDPATRERGGDLGTFAPGSHTRAFDDAAFALKVGEVSPVVETEFGFHVIKLSGREPARRVTPAEAAPEIRQQLLAAKQAQLLKDWLAEARRRAQVRVAEPYRFGALKDQYPVM
ncbi:MAG: peptidylprolyl isomerase [Pyrinomonadaceae bacterium]